ncbi:hypothetical protein ACFQ51_39235 [Streptomyces kaempferi]
MDVRITGALVRLYALPLTRIVRLTADDVHFDDHYTYQHSVDTPWSCRPSWPTSSTTSSNARGPCIAARAPVSISCPASTPGRPRNPAGLSDAMTRHGHLPGRAGRNTALMEALADLPPMVVADLFGMGAKTAERWAAFAAEPGLLPDRQPGQRQRPAYQLGSAVPRRQAPSRQ